MGILNTLFETKEEKERRIRSERRRNERKVEQDIEKFSEAIVTLTGERTRVWNQAREQLKSGLRTEAQRTLLYYKKYDIAINKLEKQKVFLQSKALQISMIGDLTATLDDIKTMAADHDIDPDKLAESLTTIEMIGDDIQDSDKIMNKVFDKDLDNMGKEVAAGDICYKDDELMAALENECAAEVLGPKVAETNMTEKHVSRDDIRAGAERLKKIISEK